MSNLPPTGRPSWREPASPGQSSRPLGPRWRSQPEGHVLRRRSRWPWARILLALLTFSAVCALFIWVSLWLRPSKDTSLVAVGASYQENLALPHNVFGWNVTQGLVDHAKTRRSHAWEAGEVQFFEGPREIRTTADLTKIPARFPGKTLLLYVALHGGADRKGAYLLPQTAFLDRDPEGSLDRDKIRVKKLIETVESLPRDRNVVLVLDATQMSENWSLGMLHNEFARELDKLNPLIEKIPNLVVINAAGIDQRSWTSEEWRQTTFGHYLIEGLKGAADEDKRDGRVNLLELFRYVKRNVEGWARTHRDAPQTPVLYPLDEAGRERARNIHVAVADDYSPAPRQAWKVFNPPTELLSAWRKHAELMQQVPRPAVYTPHLWRLYQDSLLRYEQLVMAGGSSAPKLHQQLREIEQVMLQAQKQDLGSDRNTLAMRAATGRLPQTDDTVSRDVHRLWESPLKDQVKVWQEIQAKSDLSAVHLRLQVMEQLYQRAVEDPGTYLDKAYQLMTLVDDSVFEDPMKVRPAEAHFLLMLRRDLPGLEAPPTLTSGRNQVVPVRLVSQQPARPAAISSDLVRLALRVRLRAERAALGLPDGVLQANIFGFDARYPYVEQVAPWIQPAIDQGDQARRRGQDLLFAGDPGSWEKAEKALLEADQLYANAQKDAVHVRRALNVRDLVLPMLPYYAQWLAQRRLWDAERRLNEPTLLPEKLEKLCGDFHGLLDLLAQPQPSRIAALAEQTERVTRQIDAMEEGARSLRQNLDQVESLPTIWREVDAALSMPFNNVELRRDLLQRKSQIGLRLQGETRPMDTAEDNVPRGESVKERARRHGRLNLAVLGQRWFDECGGDLESFDKVKRRLEVFAVEEKWWESLTIAGEEIGLRWQRLPGEVYRLLDKVAKKGPEQAWPDLQRADNYLRLVDDPGQAVLGKNAAGRFRQINLENLLLVQARRAMQDHWYADDPAKEPYYRRAGNSFLHDARAMSSSGFTGVDPRATELAARLADPSELRVELVKAPGLTKAGRTARTPQVNITTEEGFTLQYRLTPPAKDDFTGLPLAWVESGPGLKVEQPTSTERTVQEFRDRSAIDLGVQLSSPYLREAETKPPTLAVPLETALTVRGYYRGQFFSRATSIHLHPVPRTLVSEHQLPVRANVAVRSSKELHQQFGQGNGALVLVLDCSGSMGPGANQPFTKTTKFTEATEAIRGMLQKIPKGTQVSLWVFGQAIGEGRTVERAEDTIQQVVSPTTWDPADAQLVSGVMDRISYPAIIPWNESPILRTMVSARQDFQGATGFKTMVVITDGMDNRFDKDAELNTAKKDARVFLRETFPDIEINMIGFKVVGKEEEKARKQFQVVEELPLPGKVYLVNEARELAASLERVLRQRLRYWVDHEDNRSVAGIGDPGLDIGLDSASDQWLPRGLQPGAYKVRVHTNKRLSKSIALNRSDMLLLDIVPSRVPGASAGALDFERALYSLADFPWKPAKEKGNWRLAVLQNQLLSPKTPSPRGDAALQMLVTLEKKNDPLAATIQQVVPAKAWLEVTPPPDIKVPLAARWHYQPGYPAPAWSIDLPYWPLRLPSSIPVKPTLRAWWSLEEPLAEAILDRGHDFNQLADLADKVLRMGEEEVVIESVQVEDRPVMVDPGRADETARREVRPCLVVRLRHAAANPVWVRVPGLATAGAEHRFYSDVGKYTGIFWPVSRDQARLSLQKLEFFSLAGFKRDALGRNMFLELDNLYDPQGNDSRPLPPLDLIRGEPPAPPRPLEENPAPVPLPPALLPLPKTVPERAASPRDF